MLQSTVIPKYPCKLRRVCVSHYTFLMDFYMQLFQLTQVNVSVHISTESVHKVMQRHVPILKKKKKKYRSSSLGMCVKASFLVCNIQRKLVSFNVSVSVSISRKAPL